MASGNADIPDMGSTAEVRHALLPADPGRPFAGVDHKVFVDLLTRVGCHVYSGEVLPDGSYRELFTGPGIELFIGAKVDEHTDLSAAWNNSVHPDDRGLYLSAAVVEAKHGVIELEYRMVGRDGITRWVMDQMWQRERTTDGRRIIDGVVTDITSRKEAEIGMRRLAHSDPLTELANRLQLAERIDGAVGALHSDSAGIALLLLDLDGFKAVNDSFGHAVGDELLKMVARRLRASVRPTDVAARLGGDEFAVLLERVGYGQAEAAAHRVLQALNDPFVLSRSTVAISASIGLVHATDSRASQDLLRDADVAMYRAKAEGKNRIVGFEPSMQARVLRRLQLESDLRRGLDEREFVLHYQPLVELATGMMVGVEALVRWNHPDRGLLPPSEFIEIAEDTGLIVPLGRWVIEQATRDAAGWISAADNQMSVSVNLSPRQLHDPELVATTAYALADANLPASCLTIEITENLLLKDTELAKSRLAALRSLGIKVAVDDFGTGYSSLAYLDRYPVDILKIDRTFVDPLGQSDKHAALVRSILDLAAALEIDTVAEGVENDAQRDILRSLGCSRAQGYYFARPLPAEELSAWI